MMTRFLISAFSFFIVVSYALADDVLIDSSGNVETGISTSNGNLEVVGASGEDGIVSSTSGTGAAGVYGANSSSGNYGILGDDNYGVYGNSGSGYAGYFEGNTRVTGDLTVDGTFTGETDPTVNDLGKASLSCSSGQVAKWDGVNWACADDNDTDTTYTAGTGLDLSGTTFSVEVPLQLSSATSGVIQGTHTFSSNSGFLGGTTVGVYGTHGNNGNQGHIGGGSYGVYGEHGSSGNYGSLGSSSYGVYGSGSSGSYGVYGEDNSSGNFGYVGSSDYGVYGEETSRGTYGYLGGDDSGAAGFDSYSSGKLGYSSSFISGNHYGVYGSTSGTSAIFTFAGVYGENLTPNTHGYLGGHYGTYGENDSYGNYGYFGSSNYGAYGKHDSTGNYGYLGSNDSGVVGFDSDSSGRLGYTDSSGSVTLHYGVYGTTSGSGTFVASRAVYGSNTADDTYGYLGGDYGVYGLDNTSGNTGYIGGPTYAGYFSGDVHITGTLSKGGGSFVQPHAQDPSKEIVYAFFEGPEHAVFLRGTATLKKGNAVIKLPDHFRTVASEEGITVQFTPRSVQSKGLAAVEVSRQRIVVGELMEGDGTYEFDYFITAVRAGFEEHDPVIANKHFKPEPYETAREFERRFAKDDISTKAIRSMLISNGILTEEGKLNLATVEKLGWSVTDKEKERDGDKMVRLNRVNP